MVRDGGLNGPGCEPSTRTRYLLTVRMYTACSMEGNGDNLTLGITGTCRQTFWTRRIFKELLVLFILIFKDFGRETCSVEHTIDRVPFYVKR